MPALDSRARFLALLRDALAAGSLIKLTLGKHRGTDSSLRNVFVRPVALKSGPHLAMVWRHETRDVTKNIPVAAAATTLEALIGHDFLDAHLFTAEGNAQLETQSDGTARLSTTRATSILSPAQGAHDRAKVHPISAQAPWLHALGVTNDRGHPREGMADKFRQIQKFAELLAHLLPEAGLGDGPTCRIVDMGAGKGYLTFALADLLRGRATVRGVEMRRELVDRGNEIARAHGLGATLEFSAGTIADTTLHGCEALIALHACDTATDDALARGIAAGAKLLVVSPCCQKELRPQLRAPAVLADALQHGIFQERQAEFVTDALRAQLLEWVGFRTKVFEFISTEHTAKNLMIAGIRVREAGGPDDDRARRIREFAAFYGIRTQALARQLGFALSPAQESGRNEQ
jgi:SAM-dependent methyltransferase